MTFLGPVTFLNLEKNCIELVVGSTLDPLMEQLSWSLREVGVSWTTSSCSPCGLPGMHCPLLVGLSKRAWQTLPLLQQWVGRNSFACLLLLWVGSLVLKLCQGVDGPHQSQAACADRSWLHHGQCWSSVSRWEVCGLSCDPSCG